MITPKSILYTPAIKPNIFAKLFSCDASIGVIDLEDGVPIVLKEEARKHLKEFLDYSDIDNNKTQFAIRINELSDIEGFKDLIMLKTLIKLPDVIIMSMVSTENEVILLKNYLYKISPNKVPKIFVTIEHPKAIGNIKSIAEFADGLIFGSADYSASLTIKIGGWESLLFARCTIINSAAMFNIPAYDTAYFILEDEEGLLNETIKIKELGFSGKTAIHPKQIGIINSIFTPTSDEISEAKKIIELYEEGLTGIARMDKQMVGPPFYKLAQKILLRV